MCKNKLHLFNIYNKSLLWGQLDSRIIVHKIKPMFKDDINYIEINLEKIQSFDESFISTVFINLIKSIKKSGKELVFVFSNPANEEIIVQLSSIFLTKNIFSILKRDTGIEIIGDASYLKKIIFKNIHEHKEINPVSISKEFNKPFKSCKSEFEEFVSIGLLEKENDEIYKTNLSFV